MVTKSLLVTAILLLAACASLNPELAQQSEAVFRLQNKVASDILLLLDEPELSKDDFKKLQAAEESMLKACETLNEVAVRYRDQQRVGPIKKLGIPNSIERCRTQTKTAEELIDTVSNNLNSKM